LAPSRLAGNKSEFRRDLDAGSVYFSALLDRKRDWTYFRVRVRVSCASIARRDEGDYAQVKFGYYILNTYVPELDGGSREVYSKWLEQMDAAESLGFD
jgi:hypothetical protein